MAQKSPPFLKGEVESDRNGTNGDHQGLRFSFLLGGKVVSPPKGDWNAPPILES